MALDNIVFFKGTTVLNVGQVTQGTPSHIMFNRFGLMTKLLQRGLFPVIGSAIVKKL